MRIASPKHGGRIRWAPKWAPEVLGIVEKGGGLLRIVRLIQRPIVFNLAPSAALIEVSAAERFRFGLSRH